RQMTRLLKQPLLRARRYRPRRRAAEKRDEFPAAAHSITSSARANTLGGTSKPSALAVLMLSTVSYFVGACTGRSAGFSPFRTRSRRRRRQADTTRPDQSRRRSIRLR